MSEVKFCKDCKYSVLDFNGMLLSSPYCKKPTVDYVFGKNDYSLLEYCRKARETFCGAKAKYFEPKEKVDE